MACIRCDCTSDGPHEISHTLFRLQNLIPPIFNYRSLKCYLTTGCFDVDALQFAQQLLFEPGPYCWKWRLEAEAINLPAYASVRKGAKYMATLMQKSTREAHSIPSCPCTASKNVFHLSQAFLFCSSHPDSTTTFQIRWNHFSCYNTVDMIHLVCLSIFAPETSEWPRYICWSSTGTQPEYLPLKVGPSHVIGCCQIREPSIYLHQPTDMGKSSEIDFFFKSGWPFSGPIHLSGRPLGF